MGQDLSAERQSEPQQSNIYQPLRHHAGGRYVCAEECHREAARYRRLRPVRGCQGAGCRALCPDNGRARFPDRRFRPLLYRRERW